jgi:hypothetical protein
MPFVKGSTIGAETRFKTGQFGNPAGRPAAPSSSPPPECPRFAAVGRPR